MKRGSRKRRWGRGGGRNWLDNSREGKRDNGGKKEGGVELMYIVSSGHLVSVSPPTHLQVVHHHNLIRITWPLMWFIVVQSSGHHIAHKTKLDRIV